MDWARDFRGEIVKAQRGAYFGFDLACPTCGESVYLKPGNKRRPHFAHYSNRAKPDCEYYFPPSGVLQRYFPRLSASDSALLLKHESLRCGLFLAFRPESACFELFLRIPSLASVGQLSGSLEIQHGNGVKNLTAAQLNRANTVVVSPIVPLLECDGTGDLLALSDHLVTQVSSFGYGMNLFASTESGGRFMFTREPMEWGGRYWVVADAIITPPEKVTAVIEWNCRGSLGQWHVYEVELPTTFIESQFNAIKNVLTEYFGRTIRPRQPRAYVVHPLPHHWAEDGACVYPQPPGMLYIQRTSIHKVSVEGPPDLIAGVRITSISNEWVQIEGIQPGAQDVAILINGVEQAVIRMEECDLIQPVGLRAYSGEISWDIVEDSPLLSEQSFSQEIRIECGSNRLAEYVAKLKENSILDGVAVTLPENTDKTLRVGAFGEINLGSKLAENQKVDIEVLNSRQARELPGAIWIHGLICAKHGAQAASFVRDFIANPSQANLQKLGPILTSPLMAYIRSAVAAPVTSTN